MARLFALVALASASGLLAGGCGSTRPRAEDVFHDPALRRTTVTADETDRTLLSRLPSTEPLTIADRVFVPGVAYRAASGSLCQPFHVTQGGGSIARLACESEEGAWVFVPDVFGGDDPFSREDGAVSEAER